MSGEPKDLEVHFSDQAMEAMSGDPELAEALRDFVACARQAHHAVATGQYATFEDAMEAITGNRPEPFDPDDLDLEPLEDTDD